MIRAGLRSLVRRLLRPDETQSAVAVELNRIRSAPRYTPLSSDLLGPRIQIVDGASFCASYEEIFGRQIYAFRAAVTVPRIIDGGANIGLSVLYLKKAYPSSRIVAFEADPGVFKTLEANVREAGHNDVDLVNKALWTNEGTIEFLVEGADAGRIGREPSGGLSNRISVPTVRLREYLEEPVDFLKLDIEGAETAVLLDCEDRLGNVRSLFVEYHSFERSPQTLDQVLTLLKAAGFRVYIQTRDVSEAAALGCLHPHGHGRLHKTESIRQ